MATTMDRPGTTPVHPRPGRRAPWPVEFYRSAVGKKWVMAVTGILIMGFVFFHAFGNLKVYFGAADFNHYGEFLRELFVPLLPRTWFLWLMRGGLIVAFALHIHAAYSLTRMNHRSNAGGYQQRRDGQHQPPAREGDDCQCAQQEHRARGCHQQRGQCQVDLVFLLRDDGGEPRSGRGRRRRAHPDAPALASRSRPCSRSVSPCRSRVTPCTSAVEAAFGSSDSTSGPPS